MELDQRFIDSPAEYRVKLCKTCRMRFANFHTMDVDLKTHNDWHNETERILEELKDMHGLA